MTVKYAFVAGIAAAALFGGCAAVPPSAPTTAPPSSDPTANTSAAPSLPAGVSAATSVPTDVPNDPDARASVTITKCAATKHGWSAKGTATNGEKKDKTYEVTVFFTSQAATVLHTGSTTVTVEPGEKERWEVAGTFAAPEGTLCVLRGVA